jgi:hypothetical protein
MIEPHAVLWRKAAGPERAGHHPAPKEKLSGRFEGDRQDAVRRGRPTLGRYALQQFYESLVSLA